MHPITSDRLAQLQQTGWPETWIYSPLELLAQWLRPDNNPRPFLQASLLAAWQEARAFCVDELDLLSSGLGHWDGQPIWLETTGGWPSWSEDDPTYDGVLVFRLTGQTHQAVLAILVQRDRLWPYSAVLPLGEQFPGSLMGKMQMRDPLYSVLSALTSPITSPLPR